jgi:hypothetical protein
MEACCGQKYPVIKIDRTRTAHDVDVDIGGGWWDDARSFGCPSID